jgi:hypothetical protein
MLTTDGVAFMAASARLAIFGPAMAAGDSDQHDVVLARETHEQVRPRRSDDEQRRQAERWRPAQERQPETTSMGNPRAPCSGPNH